MNQKACANSSKRNSGEPSSSGSSIRSTRRTWKNVPRISFPHPLSWWRTRSADEFNKIDVAIARAVLTRSAIIGEPHWHLGAAGDPAVAIGVALRVQKRSGEKLILLDVAMTAVLCCAVEGDATAAVLLSGILKQRSASDPFYANLSDTWLVNKRRKRLHARKILGLDGAFR